MRAPRIEHRTRAVFAVQALKLTSRARLGGPASLSLKEVAPFCQSTISRPQNPFSGQAACLPLPKPAERGTFSVILTTVEA